MRTALFAAIILLLSGLVSYVTNLPKDIGLDVPDGKLNSLSFAPFREGQSPLLEKFPLPEQIDEDLRLLADKTYTIRTYSSTLAMRDIPELARKHGLNMIQGAWLGFVKKDIRAELDELIYAANTYPDVVKRVIVGNEVLLRGEMEPEELVQYIREVKRAVKQPVSYADVWSMYMKYPDLIKEVDFITIHILPYWEDEPIPVDKAPAHIERIYKQVQKEAESISPGKAILIGESGWPSEGRQRGWAVPSVVNEASFIRGLLKVAADNKFDVNIVEAFNQSWKSELEGVVGANWGLFSVDREEVFPLTGKVFENVNWFKHWLIASAMMILITLLYAKKLSSLSTGKIIFFLAFIQLISVILVSQAALSWYTSYDNWQRFKALLVIALNLAIAVLVIYRCRKLLNGETSDETAILLDWCYLVVIAIVLCKTYYLAVDGRYVSFPFGIGLIPVIGLIGLFISGRLVNNNNSLSEFGLTRLTGNSIFDCQRNQQIGWLIILYMFGLVIGEFKSFMVARDFIQAYPMIGERVKWAVTFTLTNCQLMAWLACLAVFAFTLLADGANTKPKQIAGQGG